MTNVQSNVAACPSVPKVIREEIKNLLNQGKQKKVQILKRQQVDDAKFDVIDKHALYDF